jgi:hypothetical protein
LTLSCIARLRSIAVLGGVVAVALLPVSAYAFQVVVAGQTYEMSKFTGSYNINAGMFALPPGGMMPWYGNEALANQFAAAVGPGLGLNVDFAIPGLGKVATGPLFSYSIGSGLLGLQVTNNALYYELTTPLLIETGTFSPLNIPRSGLVSTILSYATAKEVFVPGPLPLLGVGAAFGFSRRLSSRIRRSTTV